MATINAVDNGLSGSTGSGLFVGQTSPSISTPTISTPTITGGTFTTPTITNPTVSTGTFTSPALITPNLGVATATSLAFSPNTNGVVGVVNGSVAAAGYLGEFINSSVLSAAAVSLVSGSPIAVTSISLTPGLWMVSGNVSFVFSASTSSSVNLVGASNDSATLPDSSLFMDIFVTTTITNSGWSVPTRIYNLTSTTTIFLLAYATYSTITMKACGNIVGVRIH